MGILSIFRRKPEPEAQSRPLAAGGAEFTGLDDPTLSSYLRGSDSGTGASVTGAKSLENMAILRCTTLISESIGMLPLNLIERGDEKRHAIDHPLYAILKSTPNSWQTCYEFKSLMQLNVLLYGNAYARVIRSMGRVIGLIPMAPDAVEVSQNPDWSLTYKYTKPGGGGAVELKGEEVLHLRDLSADGVIGLSRVQLAKEAIDISLQAERAAARLFKNGMMVGGALSSPNALSDQAYKRLVESMEAHTGANNAQKWMVLEEGLKTENVTSTAIDAQHLESRNHQIEEVARAFGVPRPLLMMDDTSWGSGIEQLGIFFIQYGLQHWFTVWEQAIERTLLDEPGRQKYFAKFNERALMRGTLNDQANFFTKALGSGGHSPWMAPNEVRELQDMPRSTDPAADKLQAPSNTQGQANEPATTS